MKILIFTRQFFCIYSQTVYLDYRTILLVFIDRIDAKIFHYVVTARLLSSKRAVTT